METASGPTTGIINAPSCGRHTRKIAWANEDEEAGSSLPISQNDPMDYVTLETISQSIVRHGLTGASETKLLSAFCERCVEAGLALSSAMAVIDTLHPIWEGRAFCWRNDGVEEEPIIEYGSTSTGEAAERWQRSSFYHLLTTGDEEVRRKIGGGDPADFLLLEELLAQGHTDYLALVHRFASAGVIGEMDCIYSHWTTQKSGGFEAADCAALRRLVPTVALALKAASLARIAGTLVEIYLGKDAGQQVLSGRISRGVSERISAVLWFSDLCGFTTIADNSPPDEIIPLLNDYAEIVISAVHEAGGDVLKLIGDGTLAIFKMDDRAEACRAALRAEAQMSRGVEALNARRLAEGRPVTTLRLGLHLGEVFYGNIGSDQRLDFTVVGPAVNEVSRIVSMCRSVDRELLASAEFTAAMPDELRSQFVSVGRFALRGVRRPQELFTLDPDAAPRSTGSPPGQTSGNPKSKNYGANE